MHWIRRQKCGNISGENTPENPGRVDWVDTVEGKGRVV